ncbi:leucine-rich repeat protein 2-like [Hibiscus syriacus]|uniref:leucine-rich repeat protein 2-like n=1 Tax=Hibiscus syriacus TaxID=106335 RepID=UPI0019212DB6|nr:leucine-rich repeat protein 2-like [Hibiscus syriacus]
MDEALAVKHAVEFTANMGFHRIILEGDSRTVMNKLQSGQPDYSETNTWIGDTNMKATSFHTSMYQFTPRSGNLVAHLLAADKTLGEEDRYWVEDGPIVEEGSQIPQEIGRLRRLEVLRLTNNSISGEIPGNLSACSKLIFVNMRGNQLRGEILLPWVSRQT